MKWVSIRYCTECPFYADMLGRCRNVEGAPYTDPFNIPNWCPLEDVYNKSMLGKISQGDRKNEAI